MHTVEAALPTPTKKPPVSKRKLLANRANALRSTGPKTSRGKKAAARNAAKHGLLTREVVNTDQGESLQHFQVLLEELYNDYEPVGLTERMLVQRIATCWWRLARVHRAENGESTKEISAVYAHRRAREDRFKEDQQRLRNLKETVDGISRLGALLRRIKGEVEREGSLSGQFREVLLDCLVTDWNYPLPDKNSSDVTVFDRTERATFAAAIDAELWKLGALEKEIEERDATETLASLASASLPSGEATEKLLRYETHFERQLYRAMDELERLQRRRTGEAVLPPLKVNLRRS